MKPTLLIGIAAIAFACGGGSTQHNDSTAPGGVAPQTGAAPQAGSGSSAGSQAASAVETNGASARANERVTLIGCVQGPGQPAAIGTSGAAERARARATGNDPAAARVGAGASSDRFLLVDARAASADAAGVGANGAGGSGGPLVSGKSTFELDGIPGDARAYVNKQVRISGRVDSNPATVGGPLTGGSVGADSGAASSGRPGAGVGSPTAAEGGTSGTGSAAAGTGTASGGGHGSMGAAANRPATGASQGQMGKETAAAAAGAGNRILMVESLQVVAENCAPR
jgi:hypothetical protein